MSISDAITLIVCILGIAYTSLYLYFDYRVQVRQKEFEKRVNNFKIDKDVKIQKP